MFSTAMPIISIALFAAILSSFNSASEELYVTKNIALKAMQKEFSEKNIREVVSQTLQVEGNGCLEKRKTAAVQLKRLSELLRSQGAYMQVGKLTNENSCDCIDAGEMITGANGELLAAEGIISCTSEGLALSTGAVISLTSQRPKWQFEIVARSAGEIDAG